MTKDREAKQIQAETVQWWTAFVDMLVSSGSVEVLERTDDYPSTLVSRRDSTARARIKIRPVSDHVRLILLSAGPDQSYGLRSGDVSARIRSIIEHNVKKALHIEENL